MATENKRVKVKIEMPKGCSDIGAAIVASLNNIFDGASNTNPYHVVNIKKHDQDLPGGSSLTQIEIMKMVSVDGKAAMA